VISDVRDHTATLADMLSVSLPLYGGFAVIRCLTISTTFDARSDKLLRGAVTEGYRGTATFVAIIGRTAAG